MVFWNSLLPREQGLSARNRRRQPRVTPCLRESLWCCITKSSPVPRRAGLSRNSSPWIRTPRENPAENHLTGRWGCHCASDVRAASPAREPLCEGGTRATVEAIAALPLLLADARSSVLPDVSPSGAWSVAPARELAAPPLASPADAGDALAVARGRLGADGDAGSPAFLGELSL